MKSSFKFFFLIVVLAALFFVSNARGQFLFFQNPLSGKAAPDFELATLKGGDISFSEFRGRDNAIIFFWATWCPHCRNAFTNLNKVISELKAKNIKIAAVDIGEEGQQVKSFLDRFKIGELEVFLDKQGEVSNMYSVMGVPTFVFVGKDGVVKTVKNELPKDLDKIFWE